jgi:uncharacterized protein (TIGR03032 family)
MKLDTEFCQLPLKFDAEKLAEEIAQFSEQDWRPHPQGHKGNDALALVAMGGDPGNDSVKGPMRPTPHLDRCPYLRQVLAAFQTVVGRTRLMRISAGGEATPHIDTNYYWMQRTRVHVPIITFPEVEFICGDRTVHMAAGETWVFNTWSRHNVLNPTDQARIHLVCDTVGTVELWDMVKQGYKPFATAAGQPRKGRKKSKFKPNYIPYEPGKTPHLSLETVNFPVVMTPWEQLCLLSDLFSELKQVADNPVEQIANLESELECFHRYWKALWAQYGDRPEGWDAYRNILDQTDRVLKQYEDQMVLPNKLEAIAIVRQAVIRSALNPELAQSAAVPAPIPQTQVIAQENQAVSSTSSSPKPAVAKVIDSGVMTISSSPKPARSGTAIDSKPSQPSTFDRPIFIVAAPRSGSTMLFELLERSPSVYTIGDESHLIFESIAALSPAHRNYDSNRLTEQDVTGAIADQIKANFLAKLRDRNGNSPAPETTSLRMLEKTPKNALRIPFLRTIFPDARFIFLYREPHENISSIIDGWKSGRFVTYPKLPGWKTSPWSFLLIPEWQQLIQKDLAEIAAIQWRSANQQMMNDLAQLSPNQVCVVTYADLLTDPQAEAERLCAFAGIDWDADLQEPLPLSKYTLTPPNPEKWKKNEALLTPVLPLVEDTAKRFEQFMADMTNANQSAISELTVPVTEETAIAQTVSASPQVRQLAEPPTSSNGHPAIPDAPQVTPAGTSSSTDTPMPHQTPLDSPAATANHATPEATPDAKADAKPEEPLRSVYTTNLAGILEQLHISLLVSTYQTGKLIAVRARDGKINTHFRNFRKPMGIAANSGRLALGTQSEVWDFRNMRDVAQKLEPEGTHDACYMPRQIHTTGDIDIHEMAWDLNDELWIVNTRFSVLCTLDPNYSFVPRWRPHFVTALTPEDRCHLNGLGLVDGKPKYVTALGETDTGRGWKENKANGGILMDVEHNEVLIRGLSMPHSPRWHNGKLWVLESGYGALAAVDLKTGKVDRIIELPGFTRGVDFCGNLAFIGLSQVRETAVFSGIPITETVEERTCGVWVVDIEAGVSVAFLKFEEAVQEIFAVQVLHGIRCPDLINDDLTLIGSSYVLPDEALADVPSRSTTSAKPSQD